MNTPVNEQQLTPVPDPVQAAIDAIDALTDKQAEQLAQALWYASTSSDSALFGRRVRISSWIEERQRALDLAYSQCNPGVVIAYEGLPDLPSLWARIDARKVADNGE